MKKITLLGLLVVFVTTAGAQSPASAPTDPKELATLIKQVQAQQNLIAQNQAKIDARLATLAETIRVARIYSSRGGR